MGALPPVFIEFLGKTTGVKTAIKGVEAEIAGVDAAGAGAFQKTGMLGKAAILGLGVAAADVGVKTVKMAGDFQQQMTRVQTGAGEAQKNMQMVGQGVLAMAGDVGQSTSQLTAGLYMVESAGYHGSAALEVLKNSAEGAKVGNADLHVTADAVTTAMNAYKMGADHAAEATNALIATEAEGKTNLEALAGSMASILPTSAAAHVGLNEVLGAMATMTAQGTPAAVAATYLRQTIGQLSNPSGKAAREMQSLGLSAVQVGQNLGKNGLASTLEMLTTAIENKMGPAGTVLIEHLRKAASNTTAYQKELANLSPDQQTYIGALATMVGGTKSMMAALELTGPHMQDFKRNTEGINERVRAGGKEIEGWAAVQRNFNQQAAQAKASLGALGIEIGQYLMPYVQQAVTVIAAATAWLTQHQQAAKVAAIVIGGVLVFALAAVTAQLYAMAAAAAVNPVTWIVLGVMALIAAIVLLAMHWRTVWDGIKAATAVTVRALVAAWDWLRDGTVAVWDSISGAVTRAWQATAAWLASAWHTVTDPIVGAWRWLSATTTAVWNGITGFFRKWWPLLLVIFLPFVALVISLWNHFHAQIIGIARAVWNSVLGALRAVWAGILAIARLTWAAVQAAVISPTVAAWHALQALWRTAAGWLATAWHGIRVAAAAIWGLIRASMISPITSAWRTITGLMGRIASAISQGLHSAYNAVRGIGHDFEKIGQYIIDGMVHGIEGGAGAVAGAAKHAAGSALDAAKSFLGIASPSKKFKELGGWVVHGLVDGLTGSTASVRSAGARLARDLYVDFGTHHKALQQAVARDNRQLLALARQRDSVSGQLKAAHKKLADLQKAWASERNSIASGIMQSASIITASPDEGRAVNTTDVLDQMRQRVALALQFAANLDELRKKGLRSDLIEQLATAGVDQAGATAQALAAGSKSQIQAMNQMQASLQGAATSTGAAVADSMYGAGIKSAEGLIKGLQSQEKAIEAQMLKIAKAMQAAIKKALGIKSPSRVFAELGVFIPQGLAQGIQAGAHHATAAVAALAGAVAPPGLGISGIPGGGTRAVSNHVTVHVHGHVMTEKQLVEVVQQGFLRLGARNPSTYQPYQR